MRIHSLVVIIIFLKFSQSIKASPLDEAIRCNPFLKKISRSWQIKNDWKLLVREDDEGYRYYASITQFGVWAYLELDEQKNPKVIAKQTQNELLRISFKNGCHTEIGYSHAKSKNLPDELTDTQINNWSKKYSDYLIFIWSPELPLSMKSVPIVKELAKRKKLPLFVALYQGSSRQVASVIVQQNQYPREYLKKMNSFELVMQETSKHRPVLFRIKNGKIMKYGLFGYMSLQEYESIYKRWEHND